MAAAVSGRGVPVKETLKLGIVRNAMSRGMKAAVTTAALSQISREVDLQAAQDLRRRLTAEGRRVSLNSLILCTVSRTLPRHPLLNAELQEDQIVVYEPVNLGMAVAVPEGLIVVVIPAAQALSLFEIEAAAMDLAGRARTGQLKMPDIEGGTFTVSNLGMYGVDGGVPIPRPPESAILLVGAARPRPVVREGQITVSETAWFSLSYDHRFIDGATAAEFLRDLQDSLLDARQLTETSGREAPQS
jgi:pyruvate dehydrogenase E2 component (dihydrolipoamide acetyltransferase)